MYAAHISQQHLTIILQIINKLTDWYYIYNFYVNINPCTNYKLFILLIDYINQNNNIFLLKFLDIDYKNHATFTNICYNYFD